MDERSVQTEKRRGRPRGFGEVHIVASWGIETAGGREHEVLMAEGHYRCSCCRRADIDEMSPGPRRMR